ncbi:hypothetical protein V2J09_014464 [Rumex salicifolius]
MASRPIVPLQPRGDDIVGGKKKILGAEGKNRKALNDIGNLVPGRAPQGKAPLPTNRPVTRSFGAQLLAKAQAEVGVDNKKKHVAAAKGAHLAAQKALPPAKEKVASKPKPEQEVIVISPDIDTEEKKKVNQKKDGVCSLGSARRKKVSTTTSILTARSKAACGMVAKPKDPIVDIDAADIDNELAVVEYVEDIYKFYKETENETRPHDYIDSQPEINEKMRAILIDWLIEVHNKFELMPETLYLTINLIDRFLSLKTVPRRELQLVGIGAMLIACKYEEIWAPEVNDFVSISDRVYCNEQILRMEKAILGKLEWNITVPTPYLFLARFIKASIPDDELENMVYFLAELGLMNYSTLVYSPSMVAASAVYVARRTLHKSPAWTETLKLHTQFTESQLMDCAKLLVTLHSTTSESKLQVVLRKYSKSERYAVALCVPANSSYGNNDEGRTCRIQVKRLSKSYKIIKYMMMHLDLEKKKEKTGCCGFAHKWKAK